MSTERPYISLIDYKVQSIKPQYLTPAFVEYLWKKIPCSQPSTVSTFVDQLNPANIEEHWKGFCLDLEANLKNIICTFHREHNDPEYIKLLIQMLRKDNFSADKIQYMRKHLTERPYYWKIYKIRTDKEFKEFFQERESFVRQPNAQNNDENKKYFDFLSLRYDWIIKELYSNFTNKFELHALDFIYKDFFEYKSHRQEGRIRHQNTNQNQNHQLRPQPQPQPQDQGQSGQNQQEDNRKVLHDSLSPTRSTTQISLECEESISADGNLTLTGIFGIKSITNSLKVESSSDIQSLQLKEYNCLQNLNQSLNPSYQQTQCSKSKPKVNPQLTLQTDETVQSQESQNDLEYYSSIHDQNQGLLSIPAGAHLDKTAKSSQKEVTAVAETQHVSAMFIENQKGEEEEEVENEIEIEEPQKRKIIKRNPAPEKEFNLCPPQPKTSSPTLLKKNAQEIPIIPASYSEFEPALQGLSQDSRFTVKIKEASVDCLEINVFKRTPQGLTSTYDKIKLTISPDSSNNEFKLEVVANQKEFLSRQGNKVEEALSSKDIRSIVELWYQFLELGFEALNVKLAEFNQLFCLKHNKLNF